jgi:hypothetical protein
MNTSSSSATPRPQHGDKPETVLRRAGLADADWIEPAAVTALFMAAQKHFPRSVPSDTDYDDDTASLTLPPPMNRMIAPEYPSCLWGRIGLVRLGLSLPFVS